MAINLSDENEFSNVYGLDLVISEDHVPDCFSEEGYTDVIHGSIPLAIGDHLSNREEDYVEVFGIENVSRILTEGYEFSNGVVAEDFAITSSYNGGELVIGQVVSANRKRSYGSIPFDFIQAENFEKRLRSNEYLDSAIKSVYTVRTCVPPEEVRNREHQIIEDIKQGRTHGLEIEVIELGRGKDVAWQKAVSLLDNQ